VILTPPLSKSDAQRALVLANILGVPRDSLLQLDESTPRDVAVLATGLEQLGQDIHVEDGGLPFRVLLTQAALVPSTTTRFFGSPRLGERPIAPLIESLKQAIGGLSITRGTPWPITVESPACILPSAFIVRGEESSQFASSLLLGAARLVAQGKGPVTVTPEGSRASVGYLAMTRIWLQRVGFILEGDTVLSAPLMPAPFHIPGDWSSLTYLLLLAWKSPHWVERVDMSAEHPDKKFVEHLASVGLTLKLEGPRGQLGGDASEGLWVDVRECPDSTPTLAALACVLPAPSTFTRADILRDKESDRFEAIVRLVRAAGHTIETTGFRGFVIRAGQPRDFQFDAQDDHRMAMSAAVLAHLSKVKLTLKGQASVQKSFPHFWQEAAKVGFSAEAWN
jgi:3-phosphoshikimate 1-carboxyvinyltransferase